MNPVLLQKAKSELSDLALSKYLEYLEIDESNVEEYLDGMTDEEADEFVQGYDAFLEAYNQAFAEASIETIETL